MGSYSFQPYSHMGTKIPRQSVAGAGGVVPNNMMVSHQMAQLSSPEQVVKVVDQLGPFENMEMRKLAEIVGKDARQDINFKTQEARFGRKLINKQIELEYYAQTRGYRQTHTNMIFGDGYRGYGNGWTGNQVKIIYPKDRKRGKRKAVEPVIDIEQAELAAKMAEILVPIRIDFDMDKFRLRDTFTMNINEKVININDIAQNLLEDFCIPLNYTQYIVQSIKEQMNDFHPHVYDTRRAGAIEEKEKDKGEDKEMANATTTATPSHVGIDDREESVDVKTEVNGTPGPRIDSTAPTTPQQQQTADADMRIIIKLDITVGSHHLVDQFEWDMNCPDNNPEEFAQLMTAELSLPGEFATAIAHAIREQTQVFTKTLFLTGHGFDGKPIEDDDIRKEICVPVADNMYLRPATVIKDYTPALLEISSQELDRQDKDRDRDSRRKRRQGRQGRRMVPALPDVKETIRTFRNPVYSGFIPGGIDKYYEFLQKQANRTEESDEEEESSFRPVSTGRRGRPPGRARVTTSSSPAPYNQVAATHFPQVSYQQYQTMPLPSQEKYMVTLKVPRLKQLMTGQIRF